MKVKPIHHSSFALWLVRRKFIRSVKRANDFLIIVSLCFFVLAAFIALLPSRNTLEASLVDRYGRINQTDFSQRY